MKPNNFIQNSDYLALANTSKSSVSLHFASIAHPLIYYDPLDPSYVVFSPVQKQYQDIASPAVKGAIEQIQITFQGTTYACNEIVNYTTTKRATIIHITRINASQVRVTVASLDEDFVRTSINNPPETEEVDVQISFATFRPPNTT